jgi:hypothetical protein
MKVLAGILFIFAGGLYFLIHGFLLLRGYDKGRYLAFHSRAAGIYAEVPWDIGTLLFVVATVFENIDLAYVGFVFFGLGYVAMIFRPSFLKPDWFKWLEREHDDVYMILVREANKMGIREWSRQMQTQEDVEEWIAQVREKHEQEMRR